MSSLTSIEQLKACFALQQQAFAAQPYPSLTERQAQLKALQQALIEHEQALLAAIDQDFSGRSAHESRIADLFSSLQAIKHSRKHLASWMRAERRAVDLIFWPARNYIQYQPKGVVGIIVPWNYPVQLAIAPLQAALAAGNRVMLKLSEYTPATNAVLSTLLGKCFAQDQVAVVEGDQQMGAAFAELPWDHLFFTGSTSVGRKVMQAAAANLTPVTLELGGKSPALLAADANLEQAAKRLCFAKSLNAGQTCIAPDYVLLPEDKINDFVQAYQRTFSQFYPDLANNADYSAIINSAQYQRLKSWLDEAEQQGAMLHSMSESKLPGRRLAPVLVSQCPEHCQLMQQEIFGPWLPLVGYQSVDQALDYVRQRPRPLALYLFTDQDELRQQVLQTSHAGGVCVNDAILQVAQEDLPFGGVGPSGMGNYHGRDGFLCFSHAKAVHQRYRLSGNAMLYPPYPNWLPRVLRALMR